MARIAVIIGGGTPSAALLTELAHIGVTAVHVMPEDAQVATLLEPDTYPTKDALGRAFKEAEAFIPRQAKAVRDEEQRRATETPNPDVSTRGHRVGDMVRHPKYNIGKVVKIHNGHAVVLFEGATMIQFIGATMDDLELIASDRAQKAEAQPKAAENDEPEEPAEVLSRDARYDVLNSAQNMLDDVRDDYVVAVTLVGVTSSGAIRTYASESTGQSLNMLAQAIKVLDGTLPCEDEDEREEDPLKDHPNYDEKYIRDELTRAISHAVNYHGLDARLNMSDDDVANLIVGEVQSHLEI